MDLELVIQLLGAAGIGAALSQYLARSRERREIRSTVLKALAKTEKARWIGDADPPDFGVAANELETAAVIAGMLRAMVAEYLILAEAGRRASEASWDEYQDPETGGGIHAPLAEEIRHAARLVANSAWSPARSRIRQRQSLKSLRERIAALPEKDRAVITQAKAYSRW